MVAVSVPPARWFQAVDGSSHRPVPARALTVLVRMDHAVGAAKYTTMATGVLRNSMPNPTPSIDVAGEAADGAAAIAAAAELVPDVVLAVTDGATNAEIARQLYVSAATVKATISRILAKLELDNRVQLAVVVRSSRPR